MKEKREEAKKKRTTKGENRFLASLEKLGPREAVAGTIEDGGDMHKVISKAAKRLGAPNTQAVYNMLEFAQMIGEAENNGKLTGQNTNSTSKGLYQFNDGTVLSALNRLARVTGWKDWMKEAKEHKNANKLTWEQQTLLLMAQLTEMKGTDKSLRDIFKGDTAAMTKAYYKFHHTAPDPATRANWRRAVKRVRG